MQQFGQPDVGNSYWPKSAGERHTTCGLWLFVNGSLLAVCAVSGRRGWRFARWAVCDWLFGRLAVWGLAVGNRALLGRKLHF